MTITVLGIVTSSAKELPAAPQTTQAIAITAGGMPGLDGKSLLLRHTIYFGTRLCRSQAGDEPEALSLLASFHSATRCYAGCRGRAVTSSPVWLRTLLIYYL